MPTVRFPYRPRPTPARWPAPRAVLFIVAMSLGMWLAITFPVWGQPSAWHLTSDVLDPRAISVIITIDGIVVPDCGPGIAACIDTGGRIFYDVTARILAGVPFDVDAVVCNIVELCSAPATLSLDPSLPIPVGGLRVVPS